MNNMHEILNNQKKFYLENGSPSYELRIDRLNRVKDIVLANKDKIVDALNEDFGVRSKNQSMMTDVYSIIPDIESVNYGRGVGYEIIEHIPPSEIGEISATSIRHEMRKKGEL